MKFTLKFTFILCALLFLSACSEPKESVTTTVTPTTPIVDITPTADLCVAPALVDEVAKINKLMREFDDYSTLASNTKQDQLVVVIPELQRVLRDAEDQPVPDCLMPLKKLQLKHMETVVQTLLVFMSNADHSLVSNGISQARAIRREYDTEMARLLGITLQVPTAASVVETSAPTSSPVITLTNPGPDEINLWTAPDFNAPVFAAMPAQATAIALGRSADSQWIKVEIPNQTGQTAWVIASVVQVSIPIEQLPIVNP